MSTIEEIEVAVSRLAPSDYEKFRQWLAEYDNRLWDKEMEEDARAGRLDALLNEGLDDLKNGRCTDL
ncbi:MAG TPA: hypothetical protein VHY09_13340 [Candidatus Methylacidiphilales bacterium]|nr:hypothetical protein [Candidatus Methylacidiphilales bacterium]